MLGQVQVPGCTLSWSLLDLTPPWVAAPDTIVMHHGIGANRHIFDGWLPALIGRHRVLRFDMRGHGASARPADEPLDLERLTDDLLAVMDAAGVEQAHLLGESIGGTIVLNAGLRAADRVRSITVSNGAHVGSSIQSVVGWERMIRGEGMCAWSDFMMRGRFHPGALDEDRRTWFAAQQETTCPDTVLRMLAALVGTDLSSRLPAMRAPLLLLHPDDSPFIPVPVMAVLRSLVPGARLNVIGQARHGLPFSHSGPCSDLLEAFLTKLADDGPARI
jgi:pimeloyl-ACP methyl ester carboxylesterase